MNTNVYATDFVKNEVQNGRSISFWFDNWSSLGLLIELTGQRGCIDMGITLHATVAKAMAHNRRRHMTETLNHMETVLENISSTGLTEAADIVLWKGKGDRFTKQISSKDTWKATRDIKSKVEWYKEI
ncbi:hypothetical protein V5N11_012222 [Cardamine amara subsp. amara]|uniref:Uncharacterized protein n=1 Tax=Cardamine amara subsp. amara TaxID=228776 RepID=A0ABD1BLF9_CARAN